jgi:hypothetical protein
MEKFSQKDGKMLIISNIAEDHVFGTWYYFSLKKKF